MNFPLATILSVDWWNIEDAIDWCTQYLPEVGWEVFKASDGPEIHLYDAELLQHPVILTEILTENFIVKPFTVSLNFIHKMNTGVARRKLLLEWIRTLPTGMAIDGPGLFTSCDRDIRKLLKKGVLTRHRSAVPQKIVYTKKLHTPFRHSQTYISVVDPQYIPIPIE
jgi:hypothetical protein